ncbi:MAG: hypothetical protein JNM72_24470 [Deltaproteobacteria bacterium]|nr:hypothetical protein [Deltaproteobacteria bacterium]
MPALMPSDITAFLRCAGLALHVLEARELALRGEGPAAGRRFGDEAEALWPQLLGRLPPLSRLELLIRDAAVEWGPGFSAAACFGLDHAPAGEPFGAGWEHSVDPNGEKVRSLLRRRPEGPPTFAELAAAWGRAVDEGSVLLPVLRPGRVYVVVGLSAAAALARSFAATPGLDWARQVRVVAERPADRQLGALASLFAGASAPAPLLRAAEAAGVEGARISAADADPAVISALDPA